MVRAIKDKILPRIALAFKSGRGAATGGIPTAEDTARLVNLLLREDDEGAFAFVDHMRAQGASVDALLLELLAPAARRLGTMWEADSIDFGGVTIAISRLQRLLHHCAADPSVVTSGTASVLLITLPGEQHCFGLFIAAEYFRRAGWQLRIAPMATRDELLALVEGQWFDIVGFSVSSDRGIEQLMSEIAAVRRHSHNTRVGVILGGPMVREHPGLAASVGADMVSLDVTIAARHATALLEVMKGRN